MVMDMLQTITWWEAANGLAFGALFLGVPHIVGLLQAVFNIR